MFNLFGSGRQTMSTFNRKLNKKFLLDAFICLLFIISFKNNFRNLADIGLNFYSTLNMTSGWKP